MTDMQPHRVTKPFFTFGTLALLLFMGIGFAFGLTRMITGLGTVTNLDNHNPWGIWIAFDVACGVALAAGGFTTAALVEIFGRKKYMPLLRPAILTALLGYLWVAIAISFDLGRYWNVWRPLFNWQGNSVLFEVGMCVMAYLSVLWVEIMPSIIKGLQDRVRDGDKGAQWLARLEKPIRVVGNLVEIVLPLFIIAGVVLSCMHQSSLGTLMVIAPTKLSTLWYTPILPVLFLLSAVMVGFPMVVMESIYATISFGRNPEMHILTPLASKIPIIIGVYATVKLGDLAFRWKELNFLADPGATVALMVEILVGIVAPLLLLSQKTVRRSLGWLFFSACLVIFGVVMNRINVFLVGYAPPYSQKGYFPSMGEIAMTIAIVCSIMFCYRVFVTFFPILPGYVPPTKEELLRFVEYREKTVTPFWTWVIRGVAISLIFAFALLYTTVHKEAIAESEQVTRDVHAVRLHKGAPAPVSTLTHPFRPEGYKNLYFLNSPILNAVVDFYEASRFTHRTHDEALGGNCGVCHHRQGMSETDRVGEDMKTMHQSFDVRIEGVACASCHDMAEKKPQACRHCHGLPNEADSPSRIGIKGAYHRQCIGCHASQPPQVAAPTDCRSCHYPQPPNHKDLVKDKTFTSEKDLTQLCVDCHPRSGADVMKSAHWNWRGRTPEISGHEHDNRLGIRNVVLNLPVSSSAGLQALRRFHVGYSPKDERSEEGLVNEIDCLICHDTTGTYRKSDDPTGNPPPGLDLATIAGKVGRPSRTNCGLCHFYEGGGPNAMRGDLEPTLASPDPDFDVHMGMAEMRCQDCHKTKEHQIAGLSFISPTMEGRVTCERCHGSSPHGISGVLSRHLDDHVRSVSCETCHIPQIARKFPTRLTTDYSKYADPAEAVAPKGDPLRGSANSAAETWGKNVAPVYRWFDGKRQILEVGKKSDVQEGKTVTLNEPLGDRRNPDAKISPFKVHRAVMPYDAGQSILIPPTFWDKVTKGMQWDAVLDSAMRSMGLKYSGKMGFAATEMYTSVRHGIPRAKEALGCTDCHAVEAVTCTRCHKSAAGMDQPQHTKKAYPDVKQRIDFKALGYTEDPAFAGSRFYISLKRGTPPQ